MASGHTLYESLGVSSDNAYFAGAILSTALLAAAGLYVRSRVNKLEEKGEVVLEGKFSLLNALVEIVDAFKKLSKDLMGEVGVRYLPIIVSTFLLILIGNLTGMIAGLNSPTASLNNNLGMALVVFVLYHFFGLKEHGIAYGKQFTGGLPVPGYGLGLTAFLTLVAGLLVVLELISHVLRPITLSLRLWGVMNGDHTLVDVIYQVLPFPLVLLVPCIALALGLIVSVVQALVFTLLSTVYIKLAISHDH